MTNFCKVREHVLRNASIDFGKDVHFGYSESSEEFKMKKVSERQSTFCKWCYKIRSASDLKIRFCTQVWLGNPYQCRFEVWKFILGQETTYTDIHICSYISLYKTTYPFTELNTWLWYCTYLGMKLCVYMYLDIKLHQCLCMKLNTFVWN
jgi:hypothetical protein